MNRVITGCEVAPPTQCNDATRVIENTTAYATINATTDLMLLSMQVIERKNASRNATNSATNQLHIIATEHNSKSCAVSLSIESNNATQKQVLLRDLIARLKTVYGGDESEWREYADDVINDWLDDLDSAIECFNHLNDENRSVINNEKQEMLL